MSIVCIIIYLISTVPLLTCFYFLSCFFICSIFILLVFLAFSIFLFILMVRVLNDSCLNFFPLWQFTTDVLNLFKNYLWPCFSTVPTPFLLSLILNVFILIVFITSCHQFIFKDFFHLLYYFAHFYLLQIVLLLVIKKS